MAKGEKESCRQASKGIEGFVVNLRLNKLVVFGGCAARRLRLILLLIELWLSKLSFAHFGRRKDRLKQFIDFLGLTQRLFILLLKTYGKDLSLIGISWLTTFIFSCKKIGWKIVWIHREE